MSEASTPTPSSSSTPAAAAPSAPAQGGAAAPAFTAPPGHAVLPETEYAALKRNAERVAGMDGFVAKARAAGFNTDKDFDTFLSTRQTLQQRGIALENLPRMFEPQNAAPPTPEQAQEELIERVVGTVQSKISLDNALREHEAAEKSAFEEFVKIAAEMAGEGATDADKKLYALAARGAYDDLRNNSFYPEGHPLADKRLRPPTPDQIRKTLTGIKQEREAARLASIGDRANARPRPAMLGNPGANGAPSTPPTSDFRTMPRADRIRAVEQRLQQMSGGGPTSR